MIEAFFSTYFDKPTGEAVQPNLKIHHPVIQKIYEKYGVCTSRDGFYRIVDPEEWQEHYMPWFLFMRDEEEVFRGPELYPFMTTAFGHAYIFANLEDEDLVGYVSVNDNLHAMGDAGGFFTENLLDPIFYKFNLHGDLYEELSPIEPPLTQDECFGFFPPISLGGEASIENV